MNMFSIGKLLLTFRLGSFPLGGLNLIPKGIFIHQTNSKNNRRWFNTFLTFSNGLWNKHKQMSLFNWFLVYLSDSVFYMLTASSVILVTFVVSHIRENLKRTRIMYANIQTKFLFKLSTFFGALKENHFLIFRLHEITIRS